MSRSGRHILVIDNDTAQLDQLRLFIRENLADCSLSGSCQNKVVLAVDEAVSNIIQHAYDGHAPGSIEVEVELQVDRLTIIIRDSGRQFDPSRHEHPEISEHVRDGRRRGLGIFMMRRIMDEVHYNFREGVRNELVLVKMIND